MKRAIGIGLLVALLIIMVVIAVVGRRLLLDISRGSRVAAAFTRVGGPTRVETAVDASRFWVKPPMHVVETPANARQGIMLAAAKCAMARGAPLLFTSRTPRRRRRVDATIDNWQVEATTARLPVPEVTKIRNQSDVNGCLTAQDPAGDRVSTLTASDELLRRLRQPALPVKPRDTLASVVVFAVARGPGYPPDVAVGLALAAHMATNHRHVSLVVVPRFLEAWPGLEDQLRSQRRVVTGGVVLGSAGILTEDTHALLRQVLVSTNQQGVLGQIQTSLGTFGQILVALLPLLGVGAAAGAGAVLATHVFIPQFTQILRPPGRDPPRESWLSRMFSRLANLFRRLVNPSRSKKPDEKTPKEKPVSQEATVIQTESDWLKVLGDDRSKVVTVWLHSGSTVTGIISENSTPAVFRFNGAHVANGAPKPGFTLDPKLSVLVKVEDIQWITLGP